MANPRSSRWINWRFFGRERHRLNEESNPLSLVSQIINANIINLFTKVAIKPQNISNGRTLPIEKHKEIYVRVGENLKELRKKAGLTQQQLADKCEKVDRAKISDIENGKEDYMFSTLVEIAKGLGVGLEKLVG